MEQDLSNIQHVLIHPVFKLANPVTKVWQQWASQLNPVRFPPLSNPTDISYVEQIPPNITSIRIGGMKTETCVFDQLQALCGIPSVRNGSLQLELSRSATYGDDIIAILNQLRKTRGVLVRLVE